MYFVVNVLRYRPTNQRVDIERKYSTYDEAYKAVSKLAEAGFLASMHSHGHHYCPDYGMDIWNQVKRDRKGIASNNGYGSREVRNIRAEVIYEAYAEFQSEREYW